MDESFYSHIRIVYRFMVHIIVGSFLFVLIAITAVGLQFVWDSLIKAQALPFVETTVRFISYAILTVDLVAYAVFLAQILRILILGLWGYRAPRS
jgi:hypothetical protein